MNTLSNFIDHLLCAGTNPETMTAALNKKLAKYYVAMEIKIVPKVLNTFIWSWKTKSFFQISCFLVTEVEVDNISYF